MKDIGFNFETTYTNLPQEFYTELKVNPSSAPQAVVINNVLGDSIGLNLSILTDEELANLFSGNQLPAGVKTFSQAYAGHQFGHFTMLGDGRAHLLGEHITPQNIRLDLQFKGSGRTPYSRGGDGKAALGPMLREYLISEAMHFLGIPTTRSLAVIKTGDSVVRESVLPGAILTRVASSHIRVGTFEFAIQQQNPDAIQVLLDYTLDRHFSEVKSQNKSLSLIQVVMEKQADLIVHWMRVGFIHGVMNTDNMSLAGETIDYGPCAFMDAYDPKTVFSSIDHLGRYSYMNQPKVAQWNLARFAETLLTLIDKDINKSVELAEELINKFSEVYQEKWLNMMRSKLGLFQAHESDKQLISDLLDWMVDNNADYTNTFRSLSQLEKPNSELYKGEKFQNWYRRWQNRLRKNSESIESSIDLMKSRNPAVIPRNHKVEEALEAANIGNLKPFEDLVSILKEPYTDRAALKAYKEPLKSGVADYKTFCGT